MLEVQYFPIVINSSGTPYSSSGTTGAGADEIPPNFAASLFGAAYTQMFIRWGMCDRTVAAAATAAVVMVVVLVLQCLSQCHCKHILTVLSSISQYTQLMVCVTVV